MGVRTEGTFRNRSEANVRKSETVLLGERYNLKKGKRTRTFFSDGSGRDIMKIGVQTTGWGLVECEQIMEGNEEINIRQIGQWKGRSKMLDSVQVCEARAVLKAIQIVEAGEAVHIHTDSKGTIQKIRAMLGKAYREKRGIKNKGIIQEMIKLTREKGIPVMIEWVKGHETMAESEHNWISRMKQEGNEMADKIAKAATEEEELEEDFPIDLECILTDKKSGQYVDLRALAKIYAEKKKKERTVRLMKPADPRVSQYGQGRRSQKAKEGRTILFNMAMKAEAEIHGLAMRYAINKIETREQTSRLTVQNERIKVRRAPKILAETDYCCPMCQVCELRNVIQTKEHLWGGHCVTTKEIGKKTKEKMTETMEKWKCTQETILRIMGCVEAEWTKATEEYKDGDIEKHAAGMGLIGIWTNKTLQTITKVLTEQTRWPEELAMERSKDLAYINMYQAVEIEKIVKHNRKILSTKTQACELEMLKYQHGMESTWTQYKLTEEEIKEATCIQERMNWLKGRTPIDIREMMKRKIEEAKKEKQKERRDEEEE